MAGRLDWEKAAKRDHVRRHGSVPAWVDLPKPKPEQTKTGKSLKEKARRKCDPILKEFGALPHERRISSAKTYRERITSSCAEVRRSVPSNRERFVSVVDAVERSSLARLSKLVNNAQKRAKRKKQEKQKKESSQPERPKQLGPLGPPKHLREGTGPRARRAQVGNRRARMELPAFDVQAAITLGTLYATWPERDDVESWKVLVRSADGRVRRAASLPREKIATNIRGLLRDLAPYEVKVIGLSGREPIAVGRVEGLTVDLAANQ
jgi:hypothetical protein